VTPLDDVWRNEYVAPAPTRVMLALIRVYQRDRRATVRTVAVEAGVSVSTAFAHLNRLLEMGLLERTEHQAGTMRPTVLPVLTEARL